MKVRKNISIIVAVVMLLGLLLVTGCAGDDGVGIESIVDNEDGTFTLDLTDGTSFTTDDFTGPKDEDGDDGTNGTNGEDGISINWRGAWADGTDYEVNDAVEHNGSSYICIENHTSNAADNEPGAGTSWETYWDLCAHKGDKGDKGDTGDPGPNMILAMGHIASDGTINENYNIDTCAWNGTIERYEITFIGFDYNWNDFVTLVQPTGTSVVTATHGSIGADTLTVYLYDISGNRVQNNFSFMVLETP